MSNARYFKNNVAGLNAIALLVYDGTDTECNWDTCPKPMGLGHIGTGVRPLCARAIGMGHIGTGVGTPCPRPIGMGHIGTGVGTPCPRPIGMGHIGTGSALFVPDRGTNTAKS